MTSGLVMRTVTGRPCGTGTQRGTKANCAAIIRTVTEPSGLTRAPRLLSANSLFWPSVVGSIVSTWLGGCIAITKLETTMTRMMAATEAITTAAQRSSVLRVSCSLMAMTSSGNRAARQEHQEVDQEVGQHQKRES